jgi:hypothetical protein
MVENHVSLETYNPEDRYNYRFEVISDEGEVKLLNSNTWIMTPEDGFLQIDDLLEKYDKADLPKFLIINEGMFTDLSIEWEDIDLNSMVENIIKIQRGFNMPHEETDSDVYISYGGIAVITHRNDPDHNKLYKRLVVRGDLNFDHHINEIILPPTEDRKILDRLRKYGIDYLEKFGMEDIEEFISWFEEWICEIDEFVNPMIYKSRKRASFPSASPTLEITTEISRAIDKYVGLRSIAHMISLLNFYTDEDLRSTDAGDDDPSTWRIKLFNASLNFSKDIESQDNKLLSIAFEIQNNISAIKTEKELKHDNPYNITPISSDTAPSTNMTGLNWNFFRNIVIDRTLNRELITKIIQHEKLHDNADERDIESEEVLVTILSFVLPEYGTEILDIETIIEYDSNVKQSFKEEINIIHQRFINFREYCRENHKFDTFLNIIRLMFESISRGKSNVIYNILHKIFGSRKSDNFVDAAKQFQEMVNKINEDENIPTNCKFGNLVKSDYNKQFIPIERMFPGEIESKNIKKILQEKLSRSLIQSI